MVDPRYQQAQASSQEKRVVGEKVPFLSVSFSVPPGFCRVFLSSAEKKQSFDIFGFFDIFHKILLIPNVFFKVYSFNEANEKMNS